MIPFRGWQRPSSACCGRGPRRPANDLRPVGRLCFRPTTTSRRRRVGRTLGLSRTGQPAARRPGARNRPRCASPRRGGVSGEAVDRQAPDGMEAEAGQSRPALILGTTSGSGWRLFNDRHSGIAEREADRSSDNRSSPRYQATGRRAAVGYAAPARRRRGGGAACGGPPGREAAVRSGPRVRDSRLGR